MNSTKNMPVKKFFIVGCQRTGTTLMRLILDSHPDIVCLGETSSYAYLEQSFPLINNKINGFQTPIWTELFVEYDCIKKHLKDSLIIFMLRDVRDTIASMQNLGNWMTKELVKNIEFWLLDRNRGFNKKYNAEKIGDNWLYRWAALYWMYKTNTFFDMVDNNYNVLPINYNNLVKDPMPQIEKILDKLQIVWHDNLMMHHELLHHGVNPNGMTMGNTNARKPISIDSVDRWQTDLTTEQINEIMSLAGEMNQKILTIT